MTSEPAHEPSSSEPHGLLYTVWHGRMGRLVKFGIVGGSGVAVNLAVFQLSYFALESAVHSQDIRHTLANLCGIVVSIMTNFLLNDGWTWGDRLKGARRDWFARLGRYYATCSIAAACQLGVASLLFSYVFKSMTPFMIAQVDLIPHIPLLIGIVCGMAINFPLSHFWAFRNAKGLAHDEEEH